mgnify:CR=1 FL=1
MSYRRTVRCSHCYQTGHNKSSCPAYKAKIEEYRELGIMTSAVEKYDRSKRRKAAAAKNRSCSYCGEAGHSRAGCSKMKAQMERYRIRNKEYRSNYLKAVLENGLGPGALLSADNWGGSKMLYLVMSVDWSKVSMHDKGARVFHVLPLERLGHANKERWSSDFALSKHIRGKEFGHDYKVEVKADESSIFAILPPEYHDGKLGLKDTFRDKDWSGHKIPRDWYGELGEELDVSSIETTI